MGAFCKGHARSQPHGRADEPLTPQLQKRQKLGPDGASPAASPAPRSGGKPGRGGDAADASLSPETGAKPAAAAAAAAAPAAAAAGDECWICAGAHPFDKCPFVPADFWTTHSKETTAALRAAHRAADVVFIRSQRAKVHRVAGDGNCLFHAFTYARATQHGHQAMTEVLPCGTA